MSQFQIPQEDKAEVGYYTDPYSKERSTNIRVGALKIEKNTIYRLVSFTIVKGGAPAPTHSFSARVGTTDNPLKSGNFYKIKVDKSGVFKITTKFLRDNGMNPANINPKNFRIYGNGGLMLPEHNLDVKYSALQENAIQVVGENDGVWNEEDYALFYAQGPNGFNIYKSNWNEVSNKRIETRIDDSKNFINIYDDFAYYFISYEGSDNGK